MTDTTTTEPTDKMASPPPGGLPKAYRPSEVEGAIYERWLAADVFAPDGAGSRPDPDAEPFTIIQPPPNITGSLHLGHAQRAAVEDLMTRHARMTGKAALFLPGLDHASIAAQFVLDGIIARDGESRQSLGRERYLERMQDFVTTTREVIVSQERRLGASLDWNRLRYTMDDVSAKAVRVAFKTLHERDLAYRTEALVNWCPGCRTSVSDLEVVSTPETGTLWSIRYHRVDDATGEPLPDESVTVATTRPETILGDTAVAVHPDDARYRALVGRRVRIPFVARDVPIIADAVVDPAFGTGAVKITPAHDHDDHETGKRHGLAMPTILDDAAVVSGTGTAYDGLDRYVARTAILADLDARGDLVGEKPHEMVLGRCQRSNDVIEPRLKTQWFVRTEPLAAKALEATRSGRTRIVPDHFEKTWEHWLTTIRDWNVSRQLWWGHRIPAWYCPDGHVTVSAELEGPSACEDCGRPAAELRQDPDIFDTWFSSGLWPFSTLGWPDETDDFRRFYPTSVMETGYDIIFFWVARMMMLGIELTGSEPFHTITLSGLIRDPFGKKMSKTTGNVVDPLAVMEEAGADALRFALIHGATSGQDQRFGPQKLELARNFANKLWNAARFVLGARPTEIAVDAARTAPAEADLGPIERWIRSRAAAATAAVDRAMADYQFGEVTRALYDGIWSEFCDWGIELAKVRLADESVPVDQRAATWWTLVDALDTYLRLLHPVMPFVTEAIWAAIPHRADDPDLLMVARWPAAAGRDERVDAALGEVIETIVAIRNARAHADLPAGAWLETHLAMATDSRATFEAMAPAIGRLARARPLVPHDRSADLPRPDGALEIVLPSGSFEATVLPPAASDDAVDGAAGRDRARLEKELEEAEGHLVAARARLANTAFTDKAPPAVVEGARTRATELAEQVARLRERLGR
ncbi:MAG TPA: valine--tRNA ligase [Candidatus Limnocylindrales bacterium]|nr:valine--tRNA ligase [Candidatus Limnocylindrales bacterium]